MSLLSTKLPQKRDQTNEPIFPLRFKNNFSQTSKSQKKAYRYHRSRVKRNPNPSHHQEKQKWYKNSNLGHPKTLNNPKNREKTPLQLQKSKCLNYVPELNLFTWLLDWAVEPSLKDSFFATSLTPPLLSIPSFFDDPKHGKHPISVQNNRPTSRISH